MRSNGITADARNFVKDVQEPVLSEMMAGGCEVVHTTVNSGDLVFTPSGSLVIEDVGARDAIGLRCGVLVPRDEVGKASFRAMAENLITPSTHISKGIMRVLDAAK